MKAAHFALVTPNRAGLYSTTKDLIKGERACGVDAQMVDFNFNNSHDVRIVKDGWLESVSLESIMDSDIVVRHSTTPTSVTNNIPHLMALHGRPINTFLISYQSEKSPIIETLYQAAERKNFKGFICFWKGNTQTWAELLKPHWVYQVPPPVDLEKYSPEGKIHTWSGDYDLRLLVADMWREDSCPVSVVFRSLLTAVEMYKKNGVRVQVNLLGVPKEAREQFELIRTRSKNEFLGKVWSLVENPELLFRSADAVVTSHGLATRTIRESLACGTPVITLDPNPEYNGYHPRYREGESNFVSILETIMRKGRETTRQESRKEAEISFDANRVGRAMKTVFEEALK